MAGEKRQTGLLWEVPQRNVLMAYKKGEKRQLEHQKAGTGGGDLEPGGGDTD